MTLTSTYSTVTVQWKTNCSIGAPYKLYKSCVGYEEGRNKQVVERDAVNAQAQYIDIHIHSTYRAVPAVLCCDTPPANDQSVPFRACHLPLPLIYLPTNPSVPFPLRLLLLLLAVVLLAPAIPISCTGLGLSFSKSSPFLSDSSESLPTKTSGGLPLLFCRCMCRRKWRLVHF